MHVADYFAPDDETTISNSDQDLGSASPVLLPDSVGSVAHQQLLVTNDKQGIIYLVTKYGFIYLVTKYSFIHTL